MCGGAGLPDPGRGWVGAVTHHTALPPNIGVSGQPHHTMAPSNRTGHSEASDGRHYHFPAAPEKSLCRCIWETVTAIGDQCKISMAQIFPNVVQFSMMSEAVVQDNDSLSVDIAVVVYRSDGRSQTCHQYKQGRVVGGSLTPKMVKPGKRCRRYYTEPGA